LLRPPSTAPSVNNDRHCCHRQRTMTAGFWQLLLLTVWQWQWQLLMVVIVVVVDGGGSGIERTAPMAASLTVVAVDGGSNDGIFTNAPMTMTAILTLITLALPRTRIGWWGGGRAVTRLIRCHHSHCCWCHLCLYSQEEGAKEDGRGDRQGRNANIHGREEVGHHNPIGMEVTQGQPV
jgi:hypothetical protein